MIENIIFDWSGTLVDDLPAVWQATNHVFARAGVPPLSLEAFRNEFTLPFQRFYDRFTPHVPMPQLEAWFHGHFQSLQSSVQALPHARGFLEFCRRRKVRMFVLSTVPELHFNPQAERLAFAPYFARCYLGVRDKRGAIHDLITDNALHPQATLFVGDMAHDIDTARHGGTFSCAVLTGYSGLGQLRASSPDLIVEHLGELMRVLEEHRMQWPPRLTPAPQTRASHPVATVGAIILNAQGRLLMVQTPKWSHLWGIPGGKIQGGETSLDALRREILEETGLEIDDIRLELVQDCIGSREFYQDAHFLLLNYTCRCREPARVTLNEEACAFRWVSWEEASTLPLNQPTRLLLETVRRRLHPATPATPADTGIPHRVTPRE